MTNKKKKKLTQKITLLYEVQHVTCYNCMVIRRGCWPAKMLIIAPRSSGMLYLICKRAKPVRRSSPIVVYIERKILRDGGIYGQRETPLATPLLFVSPLLSGPPRGNSFFPLPLVSYTQHCADAAVVEGI